MASESSKRVWSSSSTLPCIFAYSSSSSPFAIFLLISVISVVKIGSVPTVDFRVGSGGTGEKEVVLATRGTVFWPTHNYPHHKRSREVQPVQLCGYRLLEAVRGLCRGNYVGFTRRSDPEVVDDHMTMMLMMRENSEKGGNNQEGLIPDKADIYRMVQDSSSPSPTSSPSALAPFFGSNGQTEQQEAALLSPGLDNQRSANSHFRYKRNIIDECCMKACSVNEMLRYCGRN